MRKINQGRHDERRRQIVEAAARCFRRDGYRGASMSAICAEAKMSPGHLYHYFENKEALVRLHVDQSLERHISELTADPALAGSEFLNRIIALAIREVGDLADNLNRHAFMIEMSAEATRNPEIAEILARKSTAASTAIADLLRFGQKQGTIDSSLAPEATALTLISLIRGMAIPPMDNPAVFPDAEKHRMIELVFRRLLEPRPE